MASMTTSTAEILDMVESLPVEMRLEIIDRLLESVSPSKNEVDEAWKAEVERRIDEVENGEVKLIALEEARERLGKRYRR